MRLERAVLKRWRFNQLPARPMVRLDLQLTHMSADDVTAWMAEKIKTLPEDTILQLRFHGNAGQVSIGKHKSGGPASAGPGEHEY